MQWGLMSGPARGYARLMKQLILPAVAAALLLLSFVRDRSRTAEAVRIAIRRFTGILAPFLAMLSLASLAITLVTPERLSALVSGEHVWVSTGLAAIIGSVALMPGFIAFPLAGILLENGVPYTVLAAFTVSLMLVGVATFPLERAYFGTGVSLLRNGLCLAVAMCIALVIGVVFGELL